MTKSDMGWVRKERRIKRIPPTIRRSDVSFIVEEIQA
jgi:hypothetical protein